MSTPAPTPDALARDIANRVAGDSYEDLLNDVHAAHRALERWVSAYRTGLTSDQHQAAITPPPLTVKEAMAALNVSRATLDKLLRAGQLHRVPALDQSGVIRIARAHIDQLIHEGTTT